MAIIPRANPLDVADPSPLPGVRNTSVVRPVEGITEAVGSVTGAINKLYEQHQDRADLTAYMDAQRQLSDWRNNFESPDNDKGMLAYKGKDALGLRDAAMPEFDSAVQGISAGLNPRVRAHFEQYALGERDSLYGSINRYSSAQYEGYMADERKAYIETQANALVKAQLTDPDEYKRQWQATLDTIYADAAANGEPSRSTQLRIDKLQSFVNKSVVDQLMTTDPLSARDYYSEHADQFQEGDKADVLRVLQPLVDDAQASEDAAAARNGTGFSTYVPVERGKPSAEQARVLDDAAAAHGVPREYLYALAEQESGFNPKAFNRETGAAGAFQYIASTAREQGINPFDFKESANAAARQFQERMAAHGPGFAVAAHFGGDGTAEAVVGRGRRAENPRTAHYLDEVRGRAERWRQQLGNVGGVETPTLQATVSVGPASNADAMERLQAITDPHRRALAESKLRDQIQIEDARREENDRLTVQSIYSDLWGAKDPSRPLAEILGPDRYAYAAQHDMIPHLSEELKFRQAGGAQGDNAKVVGPYLDMARRNPDAFVRMDVMKNARYMTKGTRDTLLNLQGQIRDGKNDANFASESEQLNSLVYGPMKMAGDSQQAKEKRALFETKWYQTKADWSRANPGKELDATTRDAMIRRLRASFAIHGVDGYEQFSPDEKSRAAIVAWLQRRKGIANPTDEQVNRTYLLGLSQ